MEDLPDCATGLIFCSFVADVKGRRPAARRVWFMTKAETRTKQTGSKAKLGRERRAFPRRPASELSFLKSVKLLAGPEVRLIDVSRGGALLESVTPIPPGTRICLRLVTTDTTVLIDGRVLRSRVSCLQPGLVRYRSAVQFEEEVALFAEDRSEEAAEAAASPEARQPAEPVPEPTESAGSSGAASSGAVDRVTVTAIVTESGHDLYEIFGVNEW